MSYCSAASFHERDVTDGLLVLFILQGHDAADAFKCFQRPRRVLPQEHSRVPEASATD